MNQNSVKYLAKILCLKTEVARNPYAVISKDVLLRYNIDIKYSDLITTIVVRHKIDSFSLVFQVFNESSINYTPVENDYGEPIILTTYLQNGHNKFPISALYIDIVISDLFPCFSRLDEEENSIIASILQIGDSKVSLKLPKMLETEITAKILYNKNIPLKTIRFYRNNKITGLEIMDRAVVSVVE
ncbi:RNA polymerase subunit RPO22 [Cetacean poxvirus 1]|nr:RNA polymerase subunit RPO22 [Cetacean poxvirus 1]